MAYNTHLPGREGAYITEITYGYPVWVYHEWPLATFPPTAFNAWGIVADIAIAVIVLLLVGMILEYFLRRSNNQARDVVNKRS